MLGNDSYIIKGQNCVRYNLTLLVPLTRYQNNIAHTRRIAARVR